jgi:hypothetical protein
LAELTKFKKVFPQLAAFTSGTWNSGFFGLPLVSILLGSNFVKEATLMTVGYWLYEIALAFWWQQVIN